MTVSIIIFWEQNLYESGLACGEIVRYVVNDLNVSSPEAQLKIMLRRVEYIYLVSGKIFASELLCLA